MLTSTPILISQITSIGFDNFHIGDWCYEGSKGNSKPDFCIYYLMQFQKNKGKNVLALLNFKTKINVITSAYIVQLGLKVQKIDVGAQKIDGSFLEIYGIINAAFKIFNKLGHSLFF